MGNCIYDKKFLDDISKVKAPGKVPLDFSTLHRPGQNYDIDGKIIPAGVKAELDKAPVAGPSNAGQANVTNTGAQPVNQAKQQNNRQMVQSKPMAPQPKQQMPAQKAPQIAQQGQRQQIQQNPNNNPLRSVMQAQQAPPPRKHQGTTSVIQNRMQIDPNRSLNSEDMYEGMDDGDNDIEEDTIEGKYDDSGFGEGNTSAAYGQPQRAPPQNQPLPNNNNRNQLPQMNQNRATVSQKQPQQVRQAQSNFNGANQGGRETILHQNAQNRPQQVYQNNQGLPKQMQPLNNPPISHNSVSQNPQAYMMT